jgi:ribonuclease VapC
MTAVWDASALLVLLQEEPGAKELAPRLPEGVMAAVNLSEVAARLIAAGGPPERVREILDGLPIAIHDFTTDLAYRAAELRSATQHLGLSLGDRACLALGLALGSPVLTADRAWLTLDLGVEIELARPG